MPRRASEDKSEKFKFEEDLIEQVREKPVLFNDCHPDYKNRTVKENAWNSIGELLNKPGQECAALWTALRGQYLAFLRRLKLPTGSGAKKGKLFFRHETTMGFCKDSELGDEGHYSNVVSPAPYSDEELYGMSPSSILIGDEMQESDEPKGSETTGMNEQSQKSIESKVPVTRTHAKFSAKRKLNTFEEKMLDVLKQEEKQGDEFDKFCESIAPKLRRLHEKNPILSSEAQFQIQKLLFKLEFPESTPNNVE